MFTLTALSLFIGTSILLILAPGPDLLFVITQGVTSGKKAGITTAIGLCLGNIVHTLAAASIFIGLGLKLLTTKSS